jgi:WD40 repeat protein
MAVWDIAAQTLTRIMEAGGDVETVGTATAVSSDFGFVALGKDTGTIQLVNLKTREAHALAGHTRRVEAVTFSSSGEHLISGSRDGTIRIWSVSQRQCMHTITAHEERVTSLALSPDDRLLATGGSDHLVRLWDFKTRRLLTTFAGHRRVVWSVTFSPDATILASGGGDRTVRLWSIPLRREVTTLKLYPPLTGDEDDLLHVSFSPDGNNLTTLTRYGKLKLLRAASFWETDATDGTIPR